MSVKYNMCIVFIYSDNIVLFSDIFVAKKMTTYVLNMD